MLDNDNELNINMTKIEKRLLTLVGSRNCETLALVIYFKVYCLGADLTCVSHRTQWHGI